MQAKIRNDLVGSRVDGIPFTTDMTNKEVHEFEVSSRTSLLPKWYDWFSMTDDGYLCSFVYHKDWLIPMEDVSNG